VAGTLDRALAYLSVEVPHWSRENRCFSCHNDGDGARALLVARRAGRAVPDEALADTLDWLRRPESWATGRGDPAFSDKRLARLQFAAALIEAPEAPDRKAALRAAGSLVAQDQQPDGSWGGDTDAVVGSPVTYGRALATWTGLRILGAAGGNDDGVRRARRWLRAFEAKSNLEAAVGLRAEVGSEGDASRRSALRDRLLRAQGSDGGFGPFGGAPSEPFDTALIVLALGELPRTERPASALDRARAYLERVQLPEGGWPETTRPAGGRSYAQHISTTAWVTLALLALERGP
jgi:prenyltransferase/squalene oxidase-like repeat protein